MYRAIWLAMAVGLVSVGNLSAQEVRSTMPTIVLAGPPPQASPTTGTVTYPPVIAPPPTVPFASSPTTVIGYKPLVPIVPTPAQFYYGRGILGQPKVYVPNQPLRNFLRYISP